MNSHCTDCGEPAVVDGLCTGCRDEEWRPVDNLRARVALLSRQNAALAEALRLADRICEEVRFKLSGGDIPSERCGECGEYGAGMLRDAVGDYIKASAALEGAK